MEQAHDFAVVRIDPRQMRAVTQIAVGAGESETLRIVVTAVLARDNVLLAMGRYLGEGFDYARLDTLFLTLPISWKGTLAQYIGRLHRQHADTREVLVMNYAGLGIPMLARRAAKRQAGYRNLGYAVEHLAISARRQAPVTTIVPMVD